MSWIESFAVENIMAIIEKLCGFMTVTSRAVILSKEFHCSLSSCCLAKVDLSSQMAWNRVTVSGAVSLFRNQNTPKAIL
jgi:hypothetical protein